MFKLHYICIAVSYSAQISVSVPTKLHCGTVPTKLHCGTAFILTWGTVRSVELWQKMINIICNAAALQSNMNGSLLHAQQNQISIHVIIKCSSFTDMLKNNVFFSTCRATLYTHKLYGANDVYWAKMSKVRKDWWWQPKSYTYKLMTCREISHLLYIFTQPCALSSTNCEWRIAISVHAAMHYGWCLVDVMFLPGIVIEPPWTSGL